MKLTQLRSTSDKASQCACVWQRQGWGFWQKKKVCPQATGCYDQTPYSVGTRQNVGSENWQASRRGSRFCQHGFYSFERHEQIKYNYVYSRINNYFSFITSSFLIIILLHLDLGMVRLLTNLTWSRVTWEYPVRVGYPLVVSVGDHLESAANCGGTISCEVIWTSVGKPCCLRLQSIISE